MKHLILLPCRGRPENIFRFLESYHKNTSEQTNICIGIDSDDFENHSKLFHEYGNKILVMERYNLSKKLNTMWSKNFGYEYYSFLADDTIIHTKNWDLIFMEYIETKLNGNGIVFANDLRHPKTEEGDDLPNHWTISSSLLNIMNFFALPVCNHMWIDNFTLQLGKKLNCIKYLKNVIIEHRHMGSNGDLIYAYSDNFFHQDKQSFENYMSNNFEILVEKIQNNLFKGNTQ